MELCINCSKHILKMLVYVKNTMELSGPRPLHLLKLPQKISVSRSSLLSFKIHKKIIFKRKNVSSSPLSSGSSQHFYYKP